MPLPAMKPTMLTLGAMLLSGLTLSDDVFAIKPLPAGYMLAAQTAAVAVEEAPDHACGEGKCGEGMCGEGKCGEGSCGQGKCNDHPTDADDAADLEASDRGQVDNADAAASRSSDD